MTDFKKYLLDEFVEDYQEGVLSRREALKLIAGVTGSLALATSILAACTPPQQPATPAPTTAPTSTPQATATTAVTTAATTAPTDTPQPTATAALAATATGAAVPSAAGGEIEASDIEFDGADGAKLLAHLARPASGDPQPVVLVCHENRGLTEHIKDVTRRFAREGYVALAVDLLSRQGGSTANDSSSIPGLLGNLPQDQFVADFTSGWRYLQTQPYVQADRVGMTGFCFGGGVTWRVAIGLPELRAAVPFYGPHPAPEEAAQIAAAVLAIYAGRDTRINQGIPAVEAAMLQNNRVYEKIIYPDTDHAFHNDTGPRYNAAAAQDAWAKTLAWFDRYLRT